MTTSPIWESPVAMPRLAAGDIHIWRIHLRAGDEQIESAFLSDDEAARRNRLPEDARIRFTCARAAMRKILGAYLGRDPRKLVFASGPHGKAFFEDRALFFNASHAGDFALIAAGRHAELGVDVEKVDPARAIRDIAARFFSSAEQSALAHLNSENFVRGFFRCWSRKEAVIKALGEGLACPLGLFDVSLDQATARLITFRRSGVSAAQWTMAPLLVHPDYEAAVAVIGPVNKLRGFDYRRSADYLGVA